MKGKPKIYLYTVAFNEPWFVELQHKQLLAHMQNDFVYCVVDNSSRPLACFRIKKYCKKHDINYYRITNNPHTGSDPSRSHAYALNYIFEDVKNRPEITHFGVLDHDIFPFGKTDIMNRLYQQKAFGLKQERDGNVYLWPGFMFFDVSTLDSEQIDCMPTKKGDTAAELGRYLDKNAQFANQQHKKFFSHGSAQADVMEVIDDSWIHLINGSDWAGVGMDEKKQKLADILAHPSQLSV